MSQLKPDASYALVTDTTFLAPSQPLAAGLKIVPANIRGPGELPFGAGNFGYSARNNLVVIGYVGGGIGVIDLNTDSFREVYAAGSGVRGTTVSPDGDSIIGVSHPSGTPITLSILPLKSAGAGRTTSYYGLPDPLIPSAPAVTSNGKAFIAVWNDDFADGPAGVILEYDFITNKWKLRTDAGSFAHGPYLAISGNHEKIVVIGGSTGRDCCVTYDAATDAFTRVSAGTAGSYAPTYSPPLSLNFDGSLMIAGNAVYDRTFQLKGNFSTVGQSGIEPTSVLAPEDYVFFRKSNGMVLGDPSTGQLIASWNLGFAPTNFYVAPDPHRTFIALRGDKFALLRLR